MEVINYQQSRLYVRPTKERQSLIKVYRDTSSLPNHPLELLARSPILEIDETKIRVKKVQVEEVISPEQPFLMDENMVKYSMSHSFQESNLRMDLTLYYQFPTVDPTQRQFIQIDFIKEEVYCYDQSGEQIETTYPFEEVAWRDGQALALSLFILNGIPVRTEVTHLFEAYNVRDGYQSIRGVEYYGPTPHLTPKPQVSYELEYQEVSMGSSIPYLTLTVHQPKTTSDVYLVYANQEKTFIEVGEEEEHLHEDVYLRMIQGESYESVLYHYKAIAISEESVSLCSNLASIELFCEPESLIHYLEVYEDGRWMQVKSLTANQLTLIGHPLFQDEAFNEFLRPDNKSLAVEAIELDTTEIGRNQITLKIPNLFNRYHPINERETHLFRVSRYYSTIDQNMSDFIYFEPQYLPIDRLLIYKTFEGEELDMDREADFEWIRKDGVYYEPYVHQTLIPDMEVNAESVSLFTSSNVDLALQLRDYLTKDSRVIYTFIVQDATGHLHQPTHYAVSI